MNNKLAVCILCFMSFSCFYDNDKNKKMEKQGKSVKSIDTIWNESNEIDRVETYYNDKISNVLFFEKGTANKAIHYIEVNNEFLPNKLFIFNEQGDTLKDKSLYHLLYYVKDTISSNEEYRFKIVLEGHIYDNAYLALSDINADFPDSLSPVVEMENLQIPLVIKGENRGWNYIRGRIDNFKDSSVKGYKTWVKVYFVDSFYVK